MNEKKLTDEEIVNAYIHCVLKRGDCDNCPYDEVGCGVDGNDLIKIINRQKAEIERLDKVEAELQDLNIEYYNDAKDLRRENKDLQNQVSEFKEERKNMQSVIFELEEDKRLLQKQVDELKERAKIDLANERNWGKIQTKQAVKDRSKEILRTLIEKAYVNECIDLTVAEVKAWFREDYGVEVE